LKVTRQWRCDAKSFSASADVAIPGGIKEHIFGIICWLSLFRRLGLCSIWLWRRLLTRGFLILGLVL
jgi:hypothetical protein